MPRASKTKGKAPEGYHKSRSSVTCHICQEVCNAKGLASHLRKHARNDKMAEVFAAKVDKRAANSPLVKTPKRGEYVVMPIYKF